MVNFYLNFKGPFCLWNRKRTPFHNLTHAWIVLTRSIIVFIITLELSFYSQNRELFAGFRTSDSHFFNCFWKKAQVNKDITVSAFIYEWIIYFGS